MSDKSIDELLAEIAELKRLVAHYERGINQLLARLEGKSDVLQ